MDTSNIIIRVCVNAIPLILAITLHEAAHVRLTAGQEHRNGYFSHPRWRKYRKGAIALMSIRNSDQP